ncbi:MAG: hypothetical protein ACTS8W_01510 [Arsenophonus sp. NC-PY1-MAG3]
MGFYAYLQWQIQRLLRDVNQTFSPMAIYYALTGNNKEFIDRRLFFLKRSAIEKQEFNRLSTELSI